MKTLHQNNINIILHYRHSKKPAQQLQQQLNQIRYNSVSLLPADLQNIQEFPDLVQQAYNVHQRLDILVNNASSFYPTPMGTATEEQWEDLFVSNAKAPFFLSQAVMPYLKTHQGCIINVADIYALRPLKQHPIYSMAKSALLMMTQSLAKELAPNIRVNAIAPGAILWPENSCNTEIQQQIIENTPLKRQGEAEDIAKTVKFLVADAPYITGQVIAVDGGRSLSFF